MTSRDAAPLVLERRGMFFVGQQRAPRYGGGSISVGQMYVEYEIPVADGPRPPLVLLPGGCHTIAAYDETPDGREGWRTWFLRRGFAVYLAEWVGRGASGFDPSPIHQAAEERRPELLPRFLHLSHEEVWTAFRFGPSPGIAHPGLQFPLDALEQYHAQLLPNTEAVLQAPEAATVEALLALLRRVGPAVVVGHSRAGNVLLPAALRSPELFAALVELEPIGCRRWYADGELARLAGTPFLSVFGDYVEGTMWQPYAEECRELAERLVAAGGSGRHVMLPDHGITGNSHMLMMDRNSERVAELLLAWLAAQGCCPRG